MKVNIVQINEVVIVKLTHIQKYVCQRYIFYMSAPQIGGEFDPEKRERGSSKQKATPVRALPAILEKTMKTH